MDFFYGLTLGYFLGLLTSGGVNKNVKPLFERFLSSTPLRAVPVLAENKLFETTIQASIEPEHIPLMWKSRMRAFVFHAEQCRTPANARDLKARIGLDRPVQMEYLTILRNAGLIYVEERKTSVWKTDWQTRHKAIATLPYPRNVEPPNFITLPVFTDPTDSAQNRRIKHSPTG